MMIDEDDDDDYDDVVVVVDEVDWLRGGRGAVRGSAQEGAADADREGEERGAGRIRSSKMMKG